MINNVIIMAGGAGKRLWPASMGTKPKQFMRIAGDESLFCATLKRAFDLDLSGNVFVVTHKDQLENMKAECLTMEPELQKRIVLIGEPTARNTAPALALAASWLILNGQKQQISLVLAADHIITPLERFKDSVNKAAHEAKNGFISLYGMIPNRPETGYGYIEAGQMADKGYQVASFREKPDAKTANQYVQSGQYYWNSGMFTYRTEVLLEELAAHSPEVAKIFSHPETSWFASQDHSGMLIIRPTEKLEKLYRECPSISIDYAVMEKSRKTRMIRADFDWNDVGSWDVIANMDVSSQNRVYNVDSKDNFVYSDRPVALCGVENLLVVSANGRILICRKGSSQLVKEAAEADLH